MSEMFRNIINMFTSSEILIMISNSNSYVYNNNGDCNVSLWKYSKMRGHRNIEDIEEHRKERDGIWRGEGKYVNKI